MLVKPERIVDCKREWTVLARFAEGQGRLALLYGPRRVGKSFLLDGFCEAIGTIRYQAIAGIPGTRLADFGRALGEWLGAGPLRVKSWTDAFERVARLRCPFLALDEPPYLIEPAPELPSVLQRHVDSHFGVPPILSDSAPSVIDRSRSQRHELDVVALRDGRVVALGEAKLRHLGARDLERLLHLRDLLAAPDAAIVLASAGGLAHELRRDRALITVDPARVYGSDAR